MIDQTPEAFISYGEIAVRLGIAVLAGALLGLDRELRGRAAGLRTHMLVALGAATTTVMALTLHHELTAAEKDANTDPLRAIEGIIAAIGFLGAGTIMRGGGEIKGLTTAANIWLCGSTGLACGAGYYVIAGIACAMTLVIVTVIGRFEHHAVKALKRNGAEGEDDPPPEHGGGSGG